jgi:hypothetical protein
MTAKQIRRASEATHALEHRGYTDKAGIWLHEDRPLPKHPPDTSHISHANDVPPVDPDGTSCPDRNGNSVPPARGIHGCIGCGHSPNDPQVNDARIQ